MKVGIIANKMNFERFCEESGQSKTVAVECFLDKCLDEYFEKPEELRKLI